ncbi:hypothetical protein H257_02419 [Aphanomyces astaci]|uniref:Centriolar satellite-associated tubulin polyglutamylase complex regulator 1 n=1 Tax=Aphanomyces astaci TaxID=112090 RepID=W4H2P2_APHAT|nr:hypothetical protein H257_02419 [Aphanomyces astaci]ETV85871.1 hypothetical protein H257_02419 [Aphanomyces astaci]|eukprot:XP_009824343.1 hypothetical protein H257_02419 [Aphanomyces astaci]
MGSHAEGNAMSIFYARKTARNSLLVHRHKPLESLSSDEYLERTGVKLFAEDAIKQLVLDRSDNAVRSFERYFSSVVMQSHVEGRKFEFVNANVRNRVAFISYLEQNFSSVDDNTELTVEDMHQLLALRCPGFPRHVMSQATAHIDITRGPKIHFRRLFTCFKACFVYNEFLRYTHDIYGQVLQGDTKKALDSVLTEIQTSDRRRSSVIAAKFGEKIVLQLQAAHTSTSEQFFMPPMSLLEVCVYTSVSFKQFCGAFLEHHVVEAGIHDLQLAYEKMANVAFRSANGIHDDMEQQKEMLKKRRSSKSKKGFA